MADSATTASPTGGQAAIDWDKADAKTIQETAGYKPFLANLHSPAALTPAQRMACGIDPGWTCNAGDKKKRNKCAAQQAAHMTTLREKCEQYAAIPPPPVLGFETPATNPQGDGAASAGIVSDAQLQEYLRVQQLINGDQEPIASAPYPAPMFGDFIPGVSVARGPVEPEQGGPLAALSAVPAWAWLLGAGALAWWVWR